MFTSTMYTTVKSAETLPYLPPDAGHSCVCPYHALAFCLHLCVSAAAQWWQSNMAMVRFAAHSSLLMGMFSLVPNAQP